MRFEVHTVFDAPIVTCEDVTIEAHEPLVREARLSIPRYGMHSFASANNEVQWSLVVKGEAIGFAAFERVSPGGASRPHDARSARDGAVGEERVPHGRWSRGMNEPLISIVIDGASRVHFPGDTLSGAIQIDVVDPQEIQAVEISVLWHTQGKGDEDLGVHHFERFTADGENRGTLHELRTFRTTLPQSPLSYDGRILKIHWCVRVRVFLTKGARVCRPDPLPIGEPSAGRTMSQPEKLGESSSVESRPPGLEALLSWNPPATPLVIGPFGCGVSSRGACSRREFLAVDPSDTFHAPLGAASGGEFPAPFGAASGGGDAVDNPFSSRYVRPGAIPFLFDWEESAAELVARLRDAGWRGEVIGPHGAGKSTLLQTPLPALKDAGRFPRLIQLQAGQRRCQFLAGPWRPRPRVTVIVIDGYEQLSWWTRFRVGRMCADAATACW